MTHQLAHTRLGWRCGFAVLPAILCWGCAVRYPDGGISVKLDYEISGREKATSNLHGALFSIAPIQNARTSIYVYDHDERTGIASRQRLLLFLNDATDAGRWVTHALQLELRHAGARVEILPSEARPTTGRVIMGQVILLRSEPIGVDVGLWPVALATEMGYKAHIRIRIQLYEENRPILRREYDIEENVPSDAFLVVLNGRPPANRDVPRAFAKVLKKLIRERILPDLAEVLKEGTSTSSTVSLQGNI